MVNRNKIEEKTPEDPLKILTNIENWCPEEFVYICTGLACLISTMLILGHLCHYNDPPLQKFIIRIVFMIPVYSLATFGIILDNEHKLEYAAVRDFYDAFVLYSFTKLLIMYLGGYNALSIHLEFKVSRIVLFKFNCA